MKILFVSYVFHPQVGGIETVSEMLATEFARSGHEVHLVTDTPGDGTGDFPFEVTRRPGAARLLNLVRWCDVMFHNNISLQSAWPLIFIRRPWVVAIHTWISRKGVLGNIKGGIKQWALRHARCISISRAIADHLNTSSDIIPNPYDSSVFRIMEDVERNVDLVFVGRLVSDKGVDVLLDAMRILKARHQLETSLTVVGDGPEREPLRTRAEDLGLGQAVRFAGMLKGEALVRELNAHALMVVPSTWSEPFGVVVLEGIACGCAIVASDAGGLPDAVGPCGVVFARGDPESLADAVAELRSDPIRIGQIRANADHHLARHRPAQVASSYLDVITRTAGEYPCL